MARLGDNADGSSSYAPARYHNHGVYLIEFPNKPDLNSIVYNPPKATRAAPAPPRAPAKPKKRTSQYYDCSPVPFDLRPKEDDGDDNKNGGDFGGMGFGGMGFGGMGFGHPLGSHPPDAFV